MEEQANITTNAGEAETLYDSERLTIKRYADGRIIARGYAIVWDSTDLEGESFTRETDLGEDLLGVKAYPMLYEHGLHPEIGAELIGRVIKTERDDIGLLIEAELDRHARYLDLVRALAEKNALGLSTGAVAHLVRREGKTIKTWPIVEVSLTPTPAEPKTLGVELAREIASKSNASAPEAERDEAEDAAREAEAQASDEQQEQEQQITEVEQVFATQTNEIKSLGDFVRAVKTGDVKALGTTVGAQGGYLVPETFVNELLTMAAEGSIVLPRAFRVDAVGTIRQPVIDLSKGNTTTLAWFGGVKFEWLSEGATIPETEPSFKQYTLRGIPFAGTTRIATRLFESPGFDNTIRTMMAQAMRAYLDYYFIRGNGTGQPLGVMNAPATVSVGRESSGEFVPEDAVKMYSHFRPLSMASAVWLVNQRVVPQLANFAVGNMPVWAADWRNGFAGTLLGIPVIVTEYASDLGQKGDVMLIDWSAYAVQLGNDVEIAISEHAFFTSDQIAIRVIVYGDGQPRVQDQASIVSSTTHKVSPFVVLQ